MTTPLRLRLHSVHTLDVLQMECLHDTIFSEEGSNSGFNHCVGDNGGPPHFGMYAWAYLNFAKESIERIYIEDYRGHPDPYVYPIGYAFRHGIELYLKHFLDSIVYPNPPSIHDHESLWQIAKKEINEFRTLPKEYVEEIELVIEYFRYVDPMHQFFRYPQDRKGNLAFIEHRIFNIENLYNHLKAVYSILQNIDRALEEYPVSKKGKA